MGKICPSFCYVKWPYIHAFWRNSHCGCLLRATHCREWQAAIIAPLIDLHRRYWPCVDKCTPSSLKSPLLLSWNVNFALCFQTVMRGTFFWLCSVSPVLTACAHPEHCLTSNGEKPLRDLRAEKRGKMQPTTTLFALYRSLCIEANSKSCKEKASASLWFRAVPGKSLPPTWRKIMSGCLETRPIILFNSAQPFAIRRVTVKPPRPQVSTEVVVLSLKSGHNLGIVTWVQVIPHSCTNRVTQH